MSALAALSAMFIVIGIGILWKQSRAKSCPVHNPAAGRIAMAAAVIALSLGVFTLIFAMFTR